MQINLLTTDAMVDTDKCSGHSLKDRTYTHKHVHTHTIIPSITYIMLIINILHIARVYNISYVIQVQGLELVSYHAVIVVPLFAVSLFIPYRLQQQSK